MEQADLLVAALMLAGVVGAARLVDLWAWFRISLLPGTLTTRFDGVLDDDGVYVISGATDPRYNGTFRLSLHGAPARG